MAVEKYQKFLEEVKNKNNDDYTEVNEIRDRHLTLDTTRQRLEEKKAELNQMNAAKRAQVSEYEYRMRNKIMDLNN